MPTSLVTKTKKKKRGGGAGRGGGNDEIFQFGGSSGIRNHTWSVRRG